MFTKLKQQGGGGFCPARQCFAATFNWAQSNGAGETATDLGASGNLFNFKTNDDATAANYSSNPITAGNCSMEVYLRGHFTGTFNKIENLQFWMSTDFSPNTGLSVTFAGNNHAYGTPSVNDNSHSAVPTSDPATANVSIGGSLSGNLAAAGYSDYIVLQLKTTTSAAPGDTSLAIFTLQYDES
jgi:hypothetical protein